MWLVLMGDDDPRSCSLGISVNLALLVLKLRENSQLYIDDLHTLPLRDHRE